MPIHHSDQLIVPYSRSSRALSLAIVLCAGLVLYALINQGNWLDHDEFFLDLIVLAGLIWLFNLPVKTLLSSHLVFAPDRIERHGLLGNSVIPSYALLYKDDINEKRERLHLFHGRFDNRRESIVIRSDAIEQLRMHEIKQYIDHHYPHAKPRSNGQRNWNVAKEANEQFDKVNNAFWLYSIIAVALSWISYLICRSITMSTNQALWSIDPFALKQAWWHLISALLSVGLYFALRQISKIDRQHPDYPAGTIVFLSSLSSLFGLLLYGEFGDRLDFYALSLVNYWLLADFAPRLSQFEPLAKFADAQNTRASMLAQRPRRSLEVSLAVLGGLSAISATHEPQANEPCRDAQGQPVACNQTSSSGGSSSSSNTRYRRSSWHSIRRGGFGGSAGHFSIGS